MMRNFFKRNKKNPEFLFTTKSLGYSTSNGDRVTANTNTSSGGAWIAIPDIVNATVGGFNQTDIATSGGTGYVMNQVPNNEVHSKKDERKAVEPKVVFAELKSDEPSKISFADLPLKIDTIEKRLAILSDHLSADHLKDEHRSLFYLKNRLKYVTKTQKKNPLDWAMTNEAAIKDLCARYKLQVVPLKQYYTLVPNEGIKEMDRYTKAYKAITGDNPIFELVIKDTTAMPEAERKEIKKKDRDPILLANSPLGNFMFVIGAWDEEVEFVDEIIYQGK